MVPKGWDIRRIEQIADVKGGKRIPKGYSLQPEDNGFPYIRVKDMSENGVDTSSILYVPTEIVESISKYTISANDVFITVAGALLGLVGKIPPTLENANLTENADKLTNLKINQDYLIAVLRSPIGKKLIEAEKTTNAQPKLALTRIRNFEIPVPPLPEQQKIANILSTWDKAISTTERLIDNSAQQKKALMQQLLTGKKRLLDDNGERFSGEWEKVKLSSLAKSGKGNFTDGDWIESPHIAEDGFRLIQTGNIGVGYFKNKNKKYISETSFDELKCTEVKVGDLLICRLAEPAGRACVVPDIGEEKMLTSVDIAIMNVDKAKSSAEYLSYYFSLEHTLYLVSALCGGSTRSRVSRTNLGKMKISLPNVKEQQKIAAVLTSADKEIEALEQQLAHLQQEKKALMQVLLTGKKRVVVDG